MTVYLLHLTTPLAHARHYIGWTTSEANVQRRYEHHKSGHGAHFTQVCNERGIDYQVARIWPNAGRCFERLLKNQKHSARLCPICNPGKAERNKKCAS